MSRIKPLTDYKMDRATEIKLQTLRTRSRWRRWLGQMCKDENYTRLLDSNYKNVLWKIRRKHNLVERTSSDPFFTKDLKKLWTEAIAVATLEDMLMIDMVVLNDKLNV